MSIRLRLILVALIALTAASVTAYWFHVAGQMRKGIESFVEQCRAEGWVVELSPIRMGGFPLSVKAGLDNIRLAPPGGIAWRADSVTITIPLTDPLTIAVDSPGFHRLMTPNWSGILSARSAQARIHLSTEGKITAIAFESSTLALEQPGIDPLTAASVTLGVDWLNPPDPSHEKPSLALTLALRGLDLPDMSGLPLARRMESFQVEARLMGSLPDSPPLASLAAWSTDGGTLELDRISLDWPPLALDADGTLALDPGLQPLLATTARIRGGGEFVVRLVQAGLVEPGMAEAAKIMLALLARPDTQGRPTLTLPLTLQDGILTAGQVRVLKLSPIPIPPPYSGGHAP